MAEKKVKVKPKEEPIEKPTEEPTEELKDILKEGDTPHQKVASMKDYREQFVAPGLVKEMQMQGWVLAEVGEDAGFSVDKRVRNTYVASAKNKVTIYMTKGK
jgi:hypothetical protein